jgi:hypothetical protein
VAGLTLYCATTPIGAGQYPRRHPRRVVGAPHPGLQTRARQTLLSSPARLCALLVPLGGRLGRSHRHPRPGVHCSRGRTVKGRLQRAGQGPGPHCEAGPSAQQADLLFCRDDCPGCGEVKGGGGEDDDILCIMYEQRELKRDNEQVCLVFVLPS